MKTAVSKISPRLTWALTHPARQAMHVYADWRINATHDEKHAYKPGPQVLLTFDDYGSAEQVAYLLKLLDAEQVKAMFFLQGDWAQSQPQLVENIARAGHIIGNHTYSHADLLNLNNEQVIDEIRRGPGSPWFRPPRGRYDDRVRQIAHSLGYKICYWTIDSDDWMGLDESYITQKVLSGLHPGAVILFHLHANNSLQALPSLIRAIRARGFELYSPKDPDWSAK